MASRRTQVLDAMVALLEAEAPLDAPPGWKPAGLVISKYRTTPLRGLPAIVLYPIKETSERAGGADGPLTLRTLLVGVECRATGDVPDEALEPLLVYAVATLLADQRLGGLSVLIEEIQTEWASVTRDDKYAAAGLQLAVDYLTLVEDLERRA